MKYIITENQYKMLFEFMQDGFDFDTLDSMPTFDEKISYCEQYLNERIGEGVGRTVFDVTDTMVIKVAQNEKEGITQNKKEWFNIQKLSQKYSIFVKMFGHADDFSWITCERVIPTEPEDFDHILGIPFSDIYIEFKNDKSRYKNAVGFKEYMKGLEDYSEYSIQDAPQIDYENNYYNKINVEDFINWSVYVIQYLGLCSIDDVIEHGEYTNNASFNVMVKYFINNTNSFARSWFREVFEYLCDLGGRNDLHLGNFGLAMRNGKPTIVVLDVGFDELNME